MKNFMDSKNHFQKFHGFEKSFPITYSLFEEITIKTSDYRTSKFIKTPVQLAVEKSISLILNDEINISLQVTPLQLDALSVGYLKCEGFILSLDELLSVDFKTEQEKIFIWLKSSPDQNKIKTEIRSSGCVGIRQQWTELRLHLDSSLKITPETIFQAQNLLVEKNELWKISGGTHISGIFSKEGSLIAYSEDIGRHTTIDKVVGEALLNDTDLKSTFLITSGRISAGTVVKCARAGIPIVISKAAPLNEGVKLAKKVNMTLVGFAREPSMNIYTGSERILIRQI